MDNPQLIANLILKGFKKHYQLFQEITAIAPKAFNQANWLAIQKASADRISYYDDRVNETIAELKARLILDQSEQPNVQLWRDIRAIYQQLLLFHPQPELAESFYNSVFCRLFHYGYFNNDFIFVKSTLSEQPTIPSAAEYRSYFPVVDGLKQTIRDIIKQFNFEVPFVNLERDIRLLVKAFIKQSPNSHHHAHQMRFDILKSPFYRNKAAYIVGRVVSKSGIQPFIVPILHHFNHGLYLDALITQSSHMRVIFGFARAYFMVQTEAPSAIVHFLNQLMPNKTPAELYSALGFHKQAKTQFYRELQHQLNQTKEQFESAAGTKGMVMTVFTLPSFPYVFKVIKDKFGEGKPFGRDTVLARYQLVKRHDRVGRMADTIEYSNVAFPLCTISDSLLEELKTTVASALEFRDNLLIIKHLYIERRMTPLNLYLQTATLEQTRTVMDEYGQALKEMISVNIFPGDMLLKNFGVTSHQRVIFYDYDEVQYLTDMNFRALPKAKNYDDYLMAHSSYSVAPQDVFPEQLTTFVTTNATVRNLLEQLHPQLLDVDYWQQAQRNIKANKFANICPYPKALRFKNDW
ncbi:bifunctional isocitrate dehydrogenase kinase/phosphatase [Pseudoalteromonas tunicata]|uniref:Isocitrate dehydrogenase kinase/phosphatase n=1 Tax=Pseudoalteromonas tunicata D2 TaxID=87626 RepID=A4CAN3_9GAMM|nr:bifunctional isocitrate dehydrogenase kinase/phosphatase [Pseudoalteromonas tunicata]ATC94986.1 isocitrate dehydrogenase kinase/phosphatase [Pseudoalteromonas tunicata]AXT30644.1 bifunctional isocitrate dehydrogenase kinase/phosphatase [Pseudoalteromonas tunicata]EAR28441.1 bifunctional isocitrate dehydrogenase kinase/phosphatase protein [Pseudoalteromonas tunicata D2]MDP5214097.1 bifunctional isocitrate dehydrogenase kinase/phosphatase [Pseudoalteromonas tunicata]